MLNIHLRGIKLFQFIWWNKIIPLLLQRHSTKRHKITAKRGRSLLSATHSHSTPQR
nr:MAG TPA: hypothetical protein [Caudoviricetes sp.]